ncbi:deoxyribodipyrimidine photolyase [Geovibrio thiophilus]|uniref:Deoxyribodipyrimidine photo-lyase n=1 Tax=Geovibrio thiophilus TaxID=139438 RepID=A0A410JZZ9_9BACT|nr:deoxyribodipyrimidine photo-lyase [Geovibrio thiophilus]QAR33742.1 deoxyribodipyrimidine photolyase [Geovibrio thiophilus]
MIHGERIISLNRPSKGGKYILLWIQQAQRTRLNHALEFAVRQANELRLPLFACFVITDGFPNANLRHYTFMLEGLNVLESNLKQRGINLVFRRGSPPEEVLKLARDAAMIVTDRGYLRIQKEWRQQLGISAPCTVVQVESDAVVPVETASCKEEFAAYTIRPKITKQLEKFLVPLGQRDLIIKDFQPDFKNIEPDTASLNIDRAVTPVSLFKGGEDEAAKHLKAFINDRLDSYDELRNDPAEDAQSGLSPYIHFGSISTLEIALAAKEHPKSPAFLEELIIRRELALNMVNFNSEYDSLKPLHPWAAQTLNEHRNDARPYIYTFDELENAQTHDPAWNTAQNEMLSTGKMHGYMRMYWGKKIMEWTKSPEEAYRTAISLNDKYSLDGRDPNGFAGVLWCFGKHDRPWQERAVFGKVRYMNFAGLKRKFDVEAYINRFV